MKQTILKVKTELDKVKTELNKVKTKLYIIQKQQKLLHETIAFYNKTNKDC